MATQTIEVRISKDGKVTIHVQGVAGTACTDLTKAFEAALGGNVLVEQTGEYFQSPDDETQGVKVSA